MAPNPEPSHLMDAIFAQATTNTDGASAGAIANCLRNLGPRELREQALASPLSSGQDPLGILSPELNTVAVLYIL